MSRPYWDSYYYFHSNPQEMTAQSLSYLPEVTCLVGSRVGFGAQVFQNSNPMFFHNTLLPFLRNKYKIKQESLEFQNVRKKQLRESRSLFFKG